MSRTTAAALVAATLGVAGCGGTTHFADKSRPATPINLSVYVNDHQVSVSPASAGAGPIVFLVTNSASKTELVTIRPADGGSRAAASTGPINPGTTAQVQADLNTGSYTVSTASPASGPPGGAIIKSAELHIGKPRGNSNSAVLQP